MLSIHLKAISVVYDALAAGYTNVEIETFDSAKLTQLIKHDQCWSEQN